jgi:hypothetical protein
MISDLDIYRSARIWLDQHGEAAIAEARSMVAAMRQQNDDDGADTWLRIIVAIEELRRNQAKPGELVN